MLYVVFDTYISDRLELSDGGASPLTGPQGVEFH